MDHRSPYNTLLIVISTIFVYVGCTANQERNFADSELLINKYDVPDDWKEVEHSNSYDFREGEKSGSYIIFQYIKTPHLVRCGEDIYHYKTNRQAARNYQRLERYHYNDESFYRTTPWLIPEEFSFSSTTAEEWRFACAGSSFTLSPSEENSVICTFLARYDEFIILFNITIEMGGFDFSSIAQVEDVIRKMDQRMANHLEP